MCRLKFMPANHALFFFFKEGGYDAVNYIHPAVAHKKGQVKDAPVISHAID